MSARRAASHQALGYVSISVIYRDASPFDALDYRVAKAMDKATVRRLPDGTYRATTPAIEFFYDDGPKMTAQSARLRLRNCVRTRAGFLPTQSGLSLWQMGARLLPQSLLSGMVAIRQFCREVIG